MVQTNTVVAMGIVTIGSAALSAMTTMLLHEYNYDSLFERIVVPTVCIGLFGTLALLYVVFFA
ncbi:hypothetical protein [Natronomonas sp. EA1]|uniref:hypothetical protein n=1 Tax=Natronomonas sp. EA1 TaxID=3421655 RepID=UPI003EB7D955